MHSSPIVSFCGFILFIACLISPANRAFALASNNIPFDRPLYLHLGKLAGFDIITSNLPGIRPSAKTKAARLALGAECFLAEGINQIGMVDPSYRH